ALTDDPVYGDAHLGKANALAAFGTQYVTSPAESAEMFGRAERSAKRAASLMPGSGRPAAMVAEISARRLDFVAALRGFEQALAAEPNDIFVLVKASNNLPWLGNGAQALARADRLISLDPLNATAYSGRGDCLYALRRYDEAIDAFNQALALAPQRNHSRYFLSNSLILLNRPGEAQEVLAKILPDDTFRRTNDAILDARGGDRAGAEAIITRMRAEQGDFASYQYAQIYAQLGDAGRAFAALDKAVEVRDPGLQWLKRDPFLDPIRRDPRYASLLKRLNFPTWT
ncbi:MAG: tetratricopeptide repeat protein, partial [Sphingomicrobium sp.]